MKRAILILLLLTVIIVGCFTVTTLNSTTITKGYSLEWGKGYHMIIKENGSPILFRFDKAVGTDAEKLTDGDRILIISDLIAEIYPARTSAYFILKLKDGEITDIPEDYLVDLSDFDWHKFTE